MAMSVLGGGGRGGRGGRGRGMEKKFFLVVGDFS